jgi:hypothetical protein
MPVPVKTIMRYQKVAAGETVSSGIYLVRLIFRDRQMTRKAALLR